MLLDCGLIRYEDQTIVLLGDAELSKSHLDRLNLVNTNFGGANLRGANLSGSAFSFMQGTGEDLLRAAQEGLLDSAFFQPAGISNLATANLSGAILKRAALMGGWLGANFAGADLEHADLRGAKLLFARNLTHEQINQAYGGANQPGPAQDTILPSYLEAPKSWSKPIHEQMREKGQLP